MIEGELISSAKKAFSGAKLPIALVLVFFLSILLFTGWGSFILFFGALTAFSVMVIIRTDPLARKGQESGYGDSLRRFILAVFVVSLVIRLFFVAAVHLNSVSNGGGGYFFKYKYERGNDDAYYHLTGSVLADSWKHGKLLDFASLMKYRGSVHMGYNAFVGLIYLICGDGILFGKAVNALLSALIPVYIFFIGMALFGEKPAKLAALLCAFDSYTIFFCGFLYKDTLITFLSLFCIWHFIKYTRTSRKTSLFLLISALIIEFFNRSYLGGALAVALFFYFVFFVLLRERRNRLVYLLMLIIISSPLFYLFYRMATSQLASRVVQVRTQEGSVESAEIGETGVFSPTRLGENLIRIFFSPLPWRNLEDSWENIFYFTYPGRWLWYIFLPFVFTGAYFALKEHFRDVFVPAGVIFQYILVLMVIMQTAYRHQAPMVPLLFLLSSYGYYRAPNPMLIYMFYLPFLALFIFRDNDLLKPGGVILALLGVIYIIYAGKIMRGRTLKGGVH